MSCPGCEIHAVVYGVTKKTDAKPEDGVIPTSSKRVAIHDVVASPVIEEEGDRTIPSLVGKLDGPDDGSVG